MYGIKVMKKLKPCYNKSLIYSRLGYKKSSTLLSGDAEKEIQELIELTEKTLDITAAYRMMNILEIKPPKVILEDGTILKGQRLSLLLENCDTALLMLATGGTKVMELISRLQRENRLSEAVVVDAAASEMTDSALDMVMALVGQIISPRGQSLTKMRFSPGYGDFDITHQREFYRLLNAQDFGITINEAYMLIPEKSVFAIAGVSSGENQAGGFNDKERIQEIIQ